jgi:NADPH-dependent 2,4-dienoyl-CoA reductase/sulfur reductase-like enzyme
VAPQDILYLRTLDDSQALRGRLVPDAHVVVVGGGFIGLEAAASAVALGCRVAVVEAADRLLPRLGCPEASEEVLAHHRAIGIDVRLGSGVARGADGALVLADGSAVRADVVIAGIGVSPDTALADAAGLAVDDGVLVDAEGRTSDPDIYAAGDVTRGDNPALGRAVRLESWHNANLQAEAVARTIVGAPPEAREAPWVWSDQGEMNLQITGAPARVTRALRRGQDRNDGGLVFFQYDGDRLVGAVAINRGREMPLIRRLLGGAQPPPPPEALADDSVPLRRLLSARESA